MSKGKFNKRAVERRQRALGRVSRRWRPAHNRHDRERLEPDDDQLELYNAPRGGGSTLPAPQDQIADLPPRTTATGLPTPKECACEPWRCFD